MLSRTSGFIAAAGFSHSLTPARNCTYGCLYCYVPTLRVFGGLRPEDWRRWGQFTTFKSNAAQLLGRELRADQRIYCSPLTDPYQPAEAAEAAMPALLQALLERPPRVFALQTRGPLVLRDLGLLQELASKTRLRISFSLTTDDDAIRRLYEPRCEPIGERLEAMSALRDAGLAVHATLAPLLPSNPEKLAELVLAATDLPVLIDPLHVRAAKPAGATTREAALRLSQRRGFEDWHDPRFQRGVVERLVQRLALDGREASVGVPAFARLAAD